MPIYAVIFDMDGLMLDTEPLYREAWQQASAECGFTLSDAQYVRFVGRRNSDAEELLIKEFGGDFPLDRFRGECRKVEKKLFATEVRKKAGVDEVLALLESRRVPRAVATSTDRHPTLARLETASLLSRLDVIVSGDEVLHGKPSPDLFLLAAERLRTPPSNCLVIEDSEPGVVAAHRAGMQVYIVPDMNPPSATTGQLADGIFVSLVAVARQLKLVLGNGAPLRT